MKLNQQTTISWPQHHRDSDDYFGVLRIVGLAIGMLMFLAAGAARVSADEALPNEASTPAAEESVLPILAGEWNLHVDDSEYAEVFAQNFPVKSGSIRNGIIVLNGEQLDYQIKGQTENGADLSIRNGKNEPLIATIDRFGNALRMALSGEHISTVIEFWNVDPNRSRTVRALRDLQLQVNRLRLEGRQEDMAVVGKNIADLTNSLKRMDVSPQITSFTQRAMEAREAGDHASADELELKASKLSTQLFANTNGFVAGSIPAGYRVVTIQADTTTNHNGLLQPGNRIDLFLTFDERDRNTGDRISRVMPLVEYVEIFAVDSRPDTEADSGQSRSISLLVTVDQAIKIKLANKKGTLSTVLRSSDDKDAISLVGIDDSDLFSASRPEMRQPSSDRAALETVQQELLLACETCEAETVKLAKDYRNAAATLPPEKTKNTRTVHHQLANLERKLVRSVELAFKTRRRLNDIKLQLAELDLVEVRAKHDRRGGLADQIIKRRVEDLKKDDPLDWTQAAAQNSANKTAATSDVVQALPHAESVPAFATPQELLVYAGAGGDPDSLDRYLEVLTDDEIRRLSGVALRAISGMKSVAGLVAVFGTEQNSEPGGADFGLWIGELSLIMDKHLRSEPSPEAQAAFAQIKMTFGLMEILNQGKSHSIVPAEAYSKTLRNSAGVLQNPRAFLSDLVMSARRLHEAQKIDDAESAEPPDWKVTVTGNTAVAIIQTPQTDSSAHVELPTVIDLVRVDDTWKVASVVTDQAILDLQQSFQSTVSDGQQDATPAAAPSSTVSASVTHETSED